MKNTKVISLIIFSMILVLSGCTNAPSAKNEVPADSQIVVAADQENAPEAEIEEPELSHT